MKQNRRKKSLSFISLNLTQFFTALNDNLYKLLLIFFLISLLGQQHSNTILSLAGGIFVVPFILFASTAGILADRYSKRTIIYFTRLLEILTTSLGVIAFYFHSVVGGYLVLFLLATQSAIFSPCKYGIIPEIVKEEKISHYNGLITATSYFAIILGTFFASFITQVTGRNFILSSFFCVLIAALGALSALGIEKTKAQSPQKKLSFHFVSEIFKALKKAKKRRYLSTTIIIGSYFLFMGAYTQLNIIPFTLQALGLSEIQGGYLFLMTAIGIGIGSFLAGQLSGKNIELGFIPIAALGITLCFIGLYLFAEQLYTVVFFLVFIGMFGGFFAVPVDSFIQSASPKEDRGQNLATYNFLSFIGVILASFFIGFLGNILNLTAAQGFFFMGCLTFIFAVLLLLLYIDPFLRLFIGFIARMFWKSTVIGADKNRLYKQALLIVPKYSWLDTIIMLALLPRQIRCIIPLEEKRGLYSILFSLLRWIPMDIQHFSLVGEDCIVEIDRELKKRRTVCLMHPLTLKGEKLAEWESMLKEYLEKKKVPIIPMHIDRKMDVEHETILTQLKSLANHRIRVEYGEKIRANSEIK